MNRLELALRRLADDLGEAGASWALVGGLAVSARSEPRFTRDIDVAVAVAHDREAEALASRLLQRGYRVLASLEQDAVGRLATIRLTPRDEQAEGLVIDLLFASSGIEPELVARAERVEILPGLPVTVAQAGDLVALKVLSRDDRERPQDLMDLRALLREASASDIALARRSLTSIQERGFHRGKALLEEFDELLR